MICSERWFELPFRVQEHIEQRRLKTDIINNRYRQYIIAAGRRSFKTERFAKRLLIMKAIENNNHILYGGAPTRTQAKNIFWNDLKLLAGKYYTKKISESELKIQLFNNSIIQIVGLEAFKRIQGGRCHGFVISEYQDCEPAVYSESIQPMLNDTGGWIVKEGRPFGKNHFYEDFLEGQKKEYGISSYHWTSREILSEEQIFFAKKELAKEDYEREYDASFESISNNPYYGFSDLNLKSHQYNPQLPVIITCDFNATEKPMSWIIGQRVTMGTSDITHWMKSVSITHTNTIMMCSIVDEYLNTLSSYPMRIIFYGDYSGKKLTSNSSFSDWQIIEKFFTNKSKIEFKRKPCLSIRDSIACTNAQLCNVLNERKQFLDGENCKHLIKDYQYARWQPNQREIHDEGLLGHCCRAVDYYNYYEHNLKKNISWSQRIT